MDDPEEYEDGPEPTPLHEPIVEEKPEEEGEEVKEESDWVLKVAKGKVWRDRRFLRRNYFIQYIYTHIT